MRFAVRECASLQGMGLQSQCEVVAIKSSRSETGTTCYSHCHVLVAPTDWPDGEYTVNIDGHSLAVRRRVGLWLAPDEPESAYLPERWALAS